METLRSPSEEGLDFKPSPPLSKISVIPHDLFYYPHYEVPLAAVLEACAEGSEDLKNEEMDLEEPEGYLLDLGAREDEADEADEAEASQSSFSFSGLGEDLPQASIVEDASPASEPSPQPSPEDHQQREAKDSVPVQGHQVRDYGVGNPAWGILCFFQNPLVRAC